MIPRSTLVGLLAVFTVSTGCGTSTRTDTKPAVHVSGSPLATALWKAEPGEEVTTPFESAEKIPLLPLSIRPATTQPQFLLSDKPEYFRTGDGIAMQERVEPGLVRLYVYHVPVPRVGQEPVGKRIVAVVDNLGHAPLNLQMKRSALAPVGGFYQKLARQVMEAIVSADTPVSQPPIKVESRAEIDPNLSAVVEVRDMLVHGWYEFTVDQPARITVAQIGAQDPLDVIDALPKLPTVLPNHHASGAGRGLFASSEFVVSQPASRPVYDTADGVMQVVIADGKADPWMSGRDSLSPGEEMLNKGNYGAVYRIRLKVRSSDQKSLAVLVASDRRDSQWCGSTSLAVRVSRGVFPSGVVLAPREKPVFKTMPAAVVLQKIDFQGSREPTEIELIYTPPGASCLPTPILLIPYEDQ